MATKKAVTFPVALPSSFPIVENLPFAPLGIASLNLEAVLFKPL